jgi:hypothetical protein
VPSGLLACVTLALPSLRERRDGGNPVDLTNGQCLSDRLRTHPGSPDVPGTQSAMKLTAAAINQGETRLILIVAV